MLHEKQIPVRSIAGRKQPVIAIIGSDGSGKTTVGEAVLASMNRNRPTKLCHLGKQAGNLSRAVKQMPVLGSLLKKRQSKERKRLKTRKESSFIAVMTDFILSMRRVYRFARMRNYHNRGFAILTDRFPQTHIPGPMDGPSLPDIAFKGWFLHKLMKLENHLYQKMTTFKPDLIIKLNVPLDVAVSRKPDHSPVKLARKISDVSRLYFDDTPVLDLDATAPLEQVIAQANKAVYEVMSHYPVTHS